MIDEIKEKMTLKEILELLSHVERGIVNLDEDELKELGEKALVKIDGYKDFIERCDCEANRIVEKIKEFQATKKTIENKKKQIEKLLLIHMNSHEFKDMVGDMYAVKVVTRRQSKLVFKGSWDTPDGQTFLKYPDLVKRSYTWDKTGVKNSVAACPDDWKDIATLEDTQSLRWSVRKGV
jgi:hypothetical protein